MGNRTKDSMPIDNTPMVLYRFNSLLIYAALPVNVATEKKIKEIFISLFFSRRQSSKVIFRVTQNSLCILLNYFPKTLLCEAGGHTLRSRWLQWLSPPHSLLITGCGLQALCIIFRWSILLRLTGMSIFTDGFIVFKKK